MYFSQGDTVQLRFGKTARIRDFIGSGGQGEVYKVDFEGQEFALKWYHPQNFRSAQHFKNFFYNIENLISNQATFAVRGLDGRQLFLWPLHITQIVDNSFGYLMKLRPAGYEEFSHFLVSSPQHQIVTFPSFTAMVQAAINIVKAFEALHQAGYSYQDINDGNFFINPQTGGTLICDNDNVAPYGKNLGILGKQRWMAPEVVTSKNLPDKQSDLFSMAEVLFRLFFVNHPLEGSYATPELMTRDLERKFYGEAPLFILDPDDQRNRPLPNSSDNIELLWGVYPQCLTDLFVKAFSQEVMMNKNKRIVEALWLNTLYQLHADICRCDCNEEYFYSSTQRCYNSRCNKTLPTYLTLTTPKCSIPLQVGKRICQRQVAAFVANPDQLIATVISAPNGQLGIQNNSPDTWLLTYPNGKSIELGSGYCAPLDKNTSISFNKQSLAHVS